MVIELCSCSGLPPHDHYLGIRQDENGVWGPHYDLDDVGRVYIDWKNLARRLMDQLDRSDTNET